MNEKALTTTNPNQLTRQSFGGLEQHDAQSETLALQARARAEIEARYVMAMQRPRSENQARIEVLQACERTRFAEAAWFRLPRGGKHIEDLSIRFAEEAMRLWGNIVVKDEVIHDDERTRHVRIHAEDLERANIVERTIVIEKIVERKKARRGDEVIGRRETSSGETVLILRASEGELKIKQNAEASKAKRVCILALLPADLKDEARDVIRDTLRRGGNVDPDAEKKRLVAAFLELGVKPRQLEEYLCHPLDDIDQSELLDLRGIYSALRSGEYSWADVMGREDERSKTAELRARIEEAKRDD